MQLRQAVEVLGRFDLWIHEIGRLIGTFSLSLPPRVPINVVVSEKRSNSFARRALGAQVLNDFSVLLPIDRTCKNDPRQLRR